MAFVELRLGFDFGVSMWERSGAAVEDCVGSGGGTDGALEMTEGPSWG